MEEFEYGDFLELDKKFLYKEYVNFLSSNENIDDVLFHIAENDYDKFQNLCDFCSLDPYPVPQNMRIHADLDPDPKP